MVDINVNTHKADSPLSDFPDQKPAIVSGYFERSWVRFAVIRQLYGLFNSRLGNPIAVFRAIRRLRKKFKNAQGDKMLAKIAKVDGRYYWKIGTPGFPSEKIKAMQGREVDTLLTGHPYNGLRTLFLAITKKCTLNCEHCFEWENLNKPEALSDEQLIEIVKKYQDYGTTQIMLSGGEPMLRLESIFNILKHTRKASDFWIFTSGLGMNEKNAKKLKQAGLTGVLLSLDHFDPELHNQFRGHKKAFQWVIDGALNAKKAGLVVTLSLCATRAFTTRQNLKHYMELGRRLGAAFVQIIDVRASGRYAGQPVDLSTEPIALLEEFYLTYNNEPESREYPIIN
ncbi:MAG: radical SAM protein, partial [Bacteroidetes bacterium]